MWDNNICVNILWYMTNFYRVFARMSSKVLDIMTSFLGNMKNDLDILLYVDWASQLLSISPPAPISCQKVLETLKCALKEPKIEYMLQFTHRGLPAFQGEKSPCGSKP